MLKNIILGITIILTPIITYIFPKQELLTQQVNISSYQTKDTNERYQFDDLTIPYLRERDYEGKLGSINVYREYSLYKSHLTSFVSDGLKINGLLTIPTGNSPQGGWPAVIFVHGYIPPTQYKTTEKYLEYIDYLSRNGVAVFKIDLRGHGNSDGEAGGAYYSSDYVIDTLNAYQALKEVAAINKNRIFLWGHSMAGNVVFRAAVVKKDIPKVFLWAGAVYSYSDFTKYGISDNSYRPPEMSSERQKRRQQLFDTYGQFNESSEFWKKVAGTNYLEGVSTKFIIQHASNDTVVSVGYSRDLHTELSRKGKASSFIEYKTGGHNISGTTFNQAMSIVLKEILE